MKIYTGRWDLLPREWEGINGLYEKSEAEIAAEVKRQAITFDGVGDSFIADFSPEEFEETFNQDLQLHFNTKDYWIKIF